MKSRMYLPPIARWVALTALIGPDAVASDSKIAVKVEPTPVRIDQPYSIAWTSNANSCISDLWGKIPGSGKKENLFAPWVGQISLRFTCDGQEQIVDITVCKSDDAECPGARLSGQAPAAAASSSGTVPASSQTQAAGETREMTSDAPRADSPLAPALAVAAPQKARWRVSAHRGNLGPDFDHSPTFVEPNGTRLYITPNIWGADKAGFVSQVTWANNGHDWGVIGVNNNDGEVHAYPSAVCGWKYATPVEYPCNGKKISGTAKAKIGFRWEGPSDCARGANRVNVLIDTYTHSKARPDAGDMPTTSVMYQSSIDCDGYYGGHARDGKDLTVGDRTYRYYTLKSDWASANTIEVFVGPCTSDHTICGSKDIVIDHLAVLKALAAKGLLSTDEYITSIQAGFELLAGGPYKVSDFWIAFDDQSESSGGHSVKNPISRSLLVSATSGDPDKVSDGDYASVFRSRGPVKICWDLSSVSNRSALQLSWWNHNTYSFDHRLIGQVGYNNPRSYSIKGFPSGRVYAQISDNSRKSRAHAFDAGKDTQVCMDVTEVDGSPQNMDVTIEVDLWDVSRGNNSILFAGDSITANSMDHLGSDPLASLAPYENAGWPGSTTLDWTRRFPEWLATHSGRYVAILLGSNDGPDGSAYLQHLEKLVDLSTQAGKIAVVASPPFSTSGDHAHMRVLAGQIANLKKSRPAVLIGPDFYSYFKAHPDLLGSDGLHPNDAGSSAIRDLWYRYFATLIR